MVVLVKISKDSMKYIQRTSKTRNLAYVEISCSGKNSRFRGSIITQLDLLNNYPSPLRPLATSTDEHFLLVDYYATGGIRT
ncbi:hypothetical protein ACTXT7_008431 [Hymenolepis weldensis]